MKARMSLGRAALVALFVFSLLAVKANAISLSTVPVVFPGLTLDGSDQLSSTSGSTWQAGGDELPAPWNVTVASTDFTNASSDTIPVANFEIRLLDANIVPTFGPPNPKASSTQTTYAALSATDLKIVTAIGAESNREYDLTPDFQLTVAAETYTGSYTATVTVTISNGP